MGFFGKIGGAIKKGVTGLAHGVGDVLSNPLVKTIGAGALAATGVGAPLAAAIGAGSGVLGGALKRGGGLKSALGQGVAGGAMGAGAGLLGKTGFMGKLGGALKGVGKQALMQGKDFATNDKGGIDFGNLGKAALGISGAIGQRQASNAQNAYNDSVISNQNKVMQMALDRMAEGSDLRKAANARLAGALSGSNANDPYRSYLNR